MIISKELMELVEEQNFLIRSIAEKSARLLEVTERINNNGVTVPATEKVPEQKPMPKHFGPDPNYIPPVPTPESKTIESHVMEWGSATKL